LENNEFCMIITSEPLDKKETREAIRLALPNFDGYLKRGQVEIIPYEEWYLQDGAFSAQKALNGWIYKLDQALAKGYDGLRTTGNTAWLEKKDWKSFTEYEEKVNNTIGQYRMVASCAYSLDKCGASELVDIVSNHQLVLIRRKDKWKPVENSERKNMEERLRQKEAFNFALFQHNPVETIAVDRKGKVVKTNLARKKARERLPQIGDVMYKDYAAKHEIDMHAELMECIRSGKKKRYPQLKYGDRFLDITIASFSDGAIITSQDITKNKLAAEALRNSENRLQSLFETMAEGVVLIAPDGEIVKANAAATRIAGLKRSEIEGHAYDSPEWNLLRPNGTKMPPEEMAGPLTMKKKRQVKDMVMGVKRPDGNISWININTALLKNKTGKLDGIVLTYADITERKLAEEEIKKSQLQLRNLVARLQSIKEEERTHIAREMHDELGQALTALKMDLSWLAKRLAKDQVLQRKKIKSMSKLVDATLQTIKKISTELRPELLDDLGLSAAIEWQAEEFQTRTGIRCEVTVEPEDIILDKDYSTAIFRIFQETLTNVARHTKATKIKVSLKEKAGRLEMRVKDNGRGITEEQASDPKSLGLIGIRERAFSFGGKVVIKGLKDRGTTVTIRIPLLKKEKTG
jgi:PAS domain S-box-containing protein